MTKRFRQMLAKLPGDIRHQVREAYRLFRRNPNHPGLRFKNVHDTEPTKFNIGDSVIVKANVKDPDYEIKIEGWQGRVTEIIDKGNLINVKWNSITLENMPDSLLDECEEEGFDWSQTYLSPADLERTKPRDTENDVEKKLKKLKKNMLIAFYVQEMVKAYWSKE